ncbi:MAG: hypothetical protein ABS913_06215 [Desemzia incerta]|uniref:hypothetical protein n=1 Tax=Desemzia incerta TaxID=82801 RepID=UPI0033150F61
MKKIVLLSLLGISVLAVGGLVVFNHEEESQNMSSTPTIDPENEIVSSGGYTQNTGASVTQPASASLKEPEFLIEVPIEGMTEEEYTGAIHSFGKMVNLEDVNREIVQMTQQKIESKELRRIMGGDAPRFPFTPDYPYAVGHLEFAGNHALMTDTNLEYLKFFIERLAIDTETTEYYQNFLTDWQNEDHSQLIEIHKALLKEVAQPSEVTEAYLAADDLELATKEQEEAYIEHYGVGQGIVEYEAEVTIFGDLF